MRHSYKVTNNNQLFLSLPEGGRSKIIHGEFSVDKYNNLIYKVNEPSDWRTVYNIPDKIHFEGKWELDDDYNLVLGLKREKYLKSKKLRLRGKIIDATENLFIFSIKSAPVPEITKIYFLKLKGIWKTDKFNRIAFEVKKKESNDTLTLKGGWQVNKNNQIVYEYEKLKTKSKQKLILEGYWNIQGKNKLCYVITKRLKTKRKKSQLNFNVFLETPNVYPARGKIKYRIKAGLKSKREEKVITLIGTWKYSRKLGLTFELDYGKEGVKRIKFIAKLNVARKDKLIFSIYNRYNQPTGLSITFLKHHPQIPNKDFEYFLRLKKEGNTPYIQLGGKIRF